MWVTVLYFGVQQEPSGWGDGTICYLHLIRDMCCKQLLGTDDRTASQSRRVVVGEDDEVDGEDTY